MSGTKTLPCALKTTSWLKCDPTTHVGNSGIQPRAGAVCQHLVKFYCIYPWPEDMRWIHSWSTRSAASIWPPPLAWAAQGKGKLWWKTRPTHLPSCHSDTFEALNANTAAPSRCTLKAPFRKSGMKVFSKQFPLSSFPMQLETPHVWSAQQCDLVASFSSCQTPCQSQFLVWCKTNPLPHRLGFSPALFF